jgi:hypothetical protein
MDKGTNATDFINGKKIPYRWGYVPVKNRSQMDTDENISLDDTKQFENFFKENYPDFVNKSGVQYLSKKLNLL